MALQEFLQEELKQSLQNKERYEEALARLPKGSIIKRNIKGQTYHYLIYREHGRFQSIYLGKLITSEDLDRNRQVKEKRAAYRKELSHVKKRISFLKKTLKKAAVID